MEIVWELKDAKLSLSLPRLEECSGYSLDLSVHRGSSCGASMGSRDSPQRRRTQKLQKLDVKLRGKWLY